MNNINIFFLIGKKEIEKKLETNKGETYNFINQHSLHQWTFMYVKL